MNTLIALALLAQYPSPGYGLQHHHGDQGCRQSRAQSVQDRYETKLAYNQYQAMLRHRLPTEQLANLARQAAPPATSPNDPWPRALQNCEYERSILLDAIQRNDLETAMRITQDLQAELRRKIQLIPAREYIAARNFLSGLNR